MTSLVSDIYVQLVTLPFSTPTFKFLGKRIIVVQQNLYNI